MTRTTIIIAALTGIFVTAGRPAVATQNTGGDPPTAPAAPVIEALPGMYQYALPHPRPAQPAPAAFVYELDGAWPGASIATEPPPPPFPQDTADAVYRSAREALNEGEYSRAAELFQLIVREHPESEYAPDALYWRAFALYRSGGTNNLRAALEALTLQSQRYPEASTRGDAATLAVRIRGEQARSGNREAAEAVAVVAERLADVSASRARPIPPALLESQARAMNAQSRSIEMQARRLEQQARLAEMSARGVIGGGWVDGESDPQCEGEDTEIRVAALNALMQMDPDRSMPVLRELLQDRDACAAPLRRQALYMVARHESEATADLLIDVMRNDPDAGVRRQAAFFTARVDDPRVVDALASMLAETDDPELYETVLLALARNDSGRARQVLRDVAASETATEEQRRHALYSLAQRGSAEDARFLQDLYGRVDSDELKQQILVSLHRVDAEGHAVWLLDRALDESESSETRRLALHWAGRTGAVPTERIAQLYDSTEDPQFKQQIIYVLAQRDDQAAVDKMIQLAREETDPEIRQTAIFWLARTDDPRAIDVLREIISNR